MTARERELIDVFTFIFISGTFKFHSHYFDQTEQVAVSKVFSDI